MLRFGIFFNYYIKVCSKSFTCSLNFNSRTLYTLYTLLFLLCLFSCSCSVCVFSIRFFVCFLVSALFSTLCCSSNSIFFHLSGQPNIICALHAIRLAWFACCFFLISFFFVCFRFFSQHPYKFQMGLRLTALHTPPYTIHNTFYFVCFFPYTIVIIPNKV